MKKAVLYICKVCKKAFKFPDEDWEYCEEGELKGFVSSAVDNGMKVRLGVCPRCG